MAGDHAKMRIRKDAVVRRYCETPQHVCEVGVGHSSMCHVSSWIGKIRVTLIDANPECIARLRRLWRHHSQLTIVHGACMDSVLEQGSTVPLNLIEGSNGVATNGWVEGIINPPVQAPGPGRVRPVPVQVPVIDFADFDDGTIDYLTVDIEGCEWYVIQALRSRPAVISVEMKVDKIYVNPHYAEIETWMQREGYVQHPKLAGGDKLWHRP